MKIEKHTCGQWRVGGCCAACDAGVGMSMGEISNALAPIATPLMYGAALGGLYLGYRFLKKSYAPTFRGAQ